MDNEFKTLYERLNENSTWPLSYMFKFIVPNSDGRVDQVVELMPKNGKINFKNTKNLKFVSITCTASMPNADEIIDISKKVARINGVIAL